MELSENALKQFKDLYSFQEEDIKDTFKRVMSEFVDKKENKELYDYGYKLLVDGIWRPNTPTWLNAGTNHKIFSACYVVDLQDSMNSIYDVANTARKIFQFGSGVGIPIGNLREKDAFIYEDNPEIIPEGKSSGPITFMKLFDAVGETTKSGGRVRRAAILCNMPINHPDNEHFISCKENDGRLSNMNISLSITDDFMRALKDGVNYDLISPYENKKVGEKSADETWNKLVGMAWKNADPGVIFIDTVNKYNPLRKEFEIKCCNPCGEQFLPPFSCCNLSAINVSKFIYNRKFDFDKLWEVAFNVMEMMDNIIDTMDYPDQRFKDNTLKYRQVGIGIMGLADAMYELDLRYNGPEGRKFAGEVMRIITTACVHKSALLAKEKEKFHDYDLFKEDMEKIVSYHIGLNSSNSDDIPSTVEVMKMVKEYGLRNSQFTTCMPTGCLVDKTLVASKKGLKRIVDYKNEKFERLTTKSDFGDNHFSGYFDQGYQYTSGIITNHGYELEGTYDHKVRVISDGNGYIWKKLKDINIGDKVVMKKGFLINKKSYFSNDICELIGYYMADGWINKSGRSNRLYFSINKNEKDYVIDLLKRTFGYLDFNIIFRESSENGYKVEINNKKLISWFEKYNCIKNGAKNAFIPEIIMNGSRSNMISFIKGYMKGDGHICKKDNIIGFTTISEEMSYNLHIMLLGLGYPSNKIKYKNTDKVIKISNRIIKNISDIYKIVLNSSYSTLLLNEMGYDINSNVKNYEKVIITPDEFKLFPENNNGFVTVDNYNSKIQDKNWFVSNDLMIEEVKEVYKSIEKVHVNDLSVYENSHTYIANGFVTHNTTALSCDASYGMEPCFGLAFQKNYIDGTKAIIINPIFEKRFKNEDWYTDNLPERIFNNGGSLKGLRGIPKEVREIFIVAHDISYKDRIDMQSEIQKFTSNGISSTINLSSDATVDDISYIYKYAYEKGLKGVTIYRDGCKKNQPVTFTDDKKDLTKFVRPNKVAGNIYKVETGNGRMYVTIGEYNKKPVEVFIQIGKSGQIMNTFSEALGRIISLALQNGVPVDEVTEKLIGINSDKSVWFRFEETDKRPSQILSAPDGLAQLLNKYYSGKKYEEELTGEICEKCGNNMSMIEGCVTCNNCGNSKCS
jgi:ribonucleotide reductase alpha subunit